ncbi:MAG: primosomal protein N' [Prevotellaceae bacterium]|jgi:primosomal protein N' (replication factor Y)|nr:primosomal protein N' [Prevotellaceae bacterium]
MYTDVILPLPLRQIYTYTVPEALREVIAVGMRVVAPFGARKRYTGIVLEIHNRPVRDGLAVKAIEAVIDERPTVGAEQLQVWRFVAEYYRASLGDVYRAALPSGLQLAEAIPQPKQELFIRANFPIDNGNVPDTILASLNRAPKQRKLLLSFVEKVGEQTDGRVSRKALLEDGTPLTVLQALTERGLFITEKQPVLQASAPLRPPVSLSTEQQIAFDTVLQQFNTFNTVLLHGVTSSGKTEIYIHLIKYYLNRGQQILYLAPEIGLTTQLTERLRCVFGEKVAVYHSRIPERERLILWNNLRENRGCEIVIGARSAVFLPFSCLGLVIVDEEHDASYKQSDSAPRYHARNIALVTASIYGAKTLLGSATPSIETYCLSVQKRYGLVELHQRYAGVELPDISVISLPESYRKKRMKGHFSLEMLDAIAQTLVRGEQVILFRNRRGYASYVQCPMCAWVAQCPHCAVSLTYHQSTRRLTCHYCGHTVTAPDTCPECGSELSGSGFGTEQVEDEVKNFFPEAVVQRMDFDTTRRRQSFEQIIDAFERHEADILVGTQMVTKGLDFDRVGLVGILHADSLLNHPDFRAAERAFQMFTQVSGRAGRKHRQGRVILQTSTPEHPVIADVVANNYRHFFDTQMAERQAFNYPPYCRLIRVVISHHDAATLNGAAGLLRQEWQRLFAHRLLGPDSPPVERTRNRYHKQFLLKIEITASQNKAKEMLEHTLASLCRQPNFRALKVYLDVDPV